MTKTKTKTFTILSSILFLVSCSNNPKCNNENVKKIALEELKNKIKLDLENQYYSQNTEIVVDTAAASVDAVATSVTHSVNEAEKAKKYAENILEKIKLESIITVSKNDSLKKCSCESHIKNSAIGNVNYYYDAQLTDEGEIYIKIKSIN